MNTTTNKLDVVAARLRHRSMGHVLFGALVAFALAFMLVAFATSRGLPMARAASPATPADVGAQIQAYTSAACGDLAPTTTTLQAGAQSPAC